LVSTVPANQWMFSDFDLSIGHFRRYSRRSLTKLLGSAGFSETTATYFFMFLMLPATILRVLPYKMGRKRDFDKVEASTVSANKIISKFGFVFSLLLSIEKFIGPPSGLSLISVSKKPHSKKSLID
jgi:hypothetical protein